MKVLVISPQAGFGNRLRALCAAQIFGLMTGRQVFHYWVDDDNLSHVEHVNDAKRLDPNEFFDLDMALFDGREVDVCFTEWLPGDFWHEQQSTGQRKLKCGEIRPIRDPREIADCASETILLETSLELMLPEAQPFRAALMSDSYARFFKLRPPWNSFIDSIPQIDNGVAVRRGNFLSYNDGAEISIQSLRERLSQLPGSKILFSDDATYLEEARRASQYLLDIYNPPNEPRLYSHFRQFLTLSKCRRVFSTRGSSFGEQAALFGNRSYDIL